MAAAEHDTEQGFGTGLRAQLEKRREAGLERETWRLEVIADPGSNSVVENPLTKERGTAFTFADLMKLAETRAVRYLKAVTCNNLGGPLGMG